MFVACFSVAGVSLVSMVAVQGCAVVMAVSYWATSAVAVALLVTVSPRGCVLRANLFALRGPMVGASAKKFARRAENPQFRRFMAHWANSFADRPLEAPCWVNFFAG